MCWGEGGQVRLGAHSFDFLIQYTIFCEQNITLPLNLLELSQKILKDRAELLTHPPDLILESKLPFPQHPNELHAMIGNVVGFSCQRQESGVDDWG